MRDAQGRKAIGAEAAENGGILVVQLISSSSHSLSLSHTHQRKKPHTRERTPVNLGLPCPCSYPRMGEEYRMEGGLARALPLLPIYILHMWTKNDPETGVEMRARVTCAARKREKTKKKRSRRKQKERKSLRPLTDLHNSDGLDDYKKRGWSLSRFTNYIFSTPVTVSNRFEETDIKLYERSFAILRDDDECVDHWNKVHSELGDAEKEMIHIECAAHFGAPWWSTILVIEKIIEMYYWSIKI